jgi:hypothetical protein
MGLRVLQWSSLCFAAPAYFAQSFGDAALVWMMPLLVVTSFLNPNLTNGANGRRALMGSRRLAAGIFWVDVVLAHATIAYHDHLCVTGPDPLGFASLFVYSASAYACGVYYLGLSHVDDWWHASLHAVTAAASAVLLSGA